MSSNPFPPIQITRRTRETEFEVVLRPRSGRMQSLPVPNRLLSHFIDHLCKAGGFELELVRTDWPGSWSFDHVLCEDLGQLVGRGIAELQAIRSTERGVAGRATVSGCMDDARADLVLSFEGRPRAEWRLPEVGTDVTGFVDSWYDDTGRMAGQAFGTNLQQFLDGFALGSGATLYVTVLESGNLHHVYEVIFRALGDAIALALELSDIRVPGDTSGLAGPATYEAGIAPIGSGTPG